MGDCGIFEIWIRGNVEFVVEGDFAGVEGEGVVEEGHFFFLGLGWVCEKREREKREIEGLRGCNAELM